MNSALDFTAKMFLALLIVLIFVVLIPVLVLCDLVMAFVKIPKHFKDFYTISNNFWNTRMRKENE